MEQVGRYRLTRRLGQGGMAEVFEAVAEGEGGFRRRVALKRVLPQLAQDLSIARMFLDEARTTSHLHHGNIVSVLDYGTADGCAFQVLEFVDGLDLDGLLRRAEERKRPLPLGLTLYIVLQVARALDYAHDAKDETGQRLGIVHRDVSPSNVLVSWDGHVKLSDFGIALAANRLERTEGAGVKGKLEYMSPEQVMRGNVDRRSDVFALGCMLHRVLTGKSPLAELSALTRMASGEELSVDASLDGPVREVIVRATRHAQTQRYGSAAEFARALSLLLPQYLPEEPTVALQAWLNTLREPAAEKKRGALDALLNVELVLEPQGAATQERSFTLHAPSTSAPSDSHAIATGEASREAPAQTVSSDPIATSTSRRGVWFAFSLALAALVALYTTRDVTTQEAALPRALPAPIPMPAPPERADPSPPAAPPTLDNARSPEVETHTATSIPETRARRVRSRVKDAPTEASAGAAPEPPSAGVGTLVIGGDGALRAEIRIDGRSFGFAPKRIELSAGLHEILLLRADGTRVGPRSVRIEPHHTQTAPAKWRVD